MRYFNTNLGVYAKYGLAQARSMSAPASTDGDECSHPVVLVLRSLGQQQRTRLLTVARDLERVAGVWVGEGRYKN